MPENTEWCPQDADGKGLNLRILYPAIVSFISKGHGELFSDKQELRIHGMHGGYSPPLYTYKALLSSLLPLPLQPLPLSPLHGAHYTTARPLSLHSAHSPSSVPAQSLSTCHFLWLPMASFFWLFKAHLDVPPQRGMGLLPCILFTQTHTQRMSTHERAQTYTQLEVPRGQESTWSSSP